MTSFDFSNVKKQEVPRDRTAIFTFYRLEGNPRLTVRPATEANPGYMRAMLKGSKEQVRRLKGGDLSPEMLEENRAKDRKLFPIHIVVGWDAVTDASGKAVQFGRDACAAFIEALPYDQFNELRDFCATMDNFRPEFEVDDLDRDELVGNSQSG